MDYAMESLRAAISNEKGQVESLRKKVKAQTKLHHNQEKTTVAKLKQELRIAHREADDAEKAQKEACSSLSAALGEAAAKVEGLKQQQEWMEGEVESARVETDRLWVQLQAGPKEGKSQTAEQKHAVSLLQEQRREADSRLAKARATYSDVQSDEAALERELVAMAAALERSRAEMSRHKVDLMSLDARMSAESELRELEAVCARKQSVVASLTKELERAASPFDSMVTDTRNSKPSKAVAPPPPRGTGAGGVAGGAGPAWFVSRRGVINAS